MTDDEVLSGLKEMSYSQTEMQDVIKLVWDPKFNNDTMMLICRRLIDTVITGYKNDNV